jgi:uncharacterized protein (TIGR02145 family)
MKKRFTYLMLLTLIGLSTLTAQIINIPADYPTIQQGIDASQNGDTVLVQPGTYFEPIIYNGKSIIVCSKYLTTGDKNYIEQTCINGTTDDLPCVRIINGETAETKLVGFTICNGYTTSFQFGGGIYITGGSSPTLDHLIIKNNNTQSGGGGGIHGYYGGNIKITNTLFENNISSEMGGGLYLFSMFAEIINCEFRNNTSSQGAAIGLFRASASIINSVIHKNNGNYAINIYEQSQTVHFINSVVSNNNTPVGILLSGTCAPKMINSIVTGHPETNIKIIGGGPFYIDYSIIEGGQEGVNLVYPAQLQYYDHNFDQNPGFINPSQNNFALSNNSIAIGKGIFELILAEDTLTVPLFDKEYNPRPTPSGSMPDIGAFENQLGQPYDPSHVAYYPFNGNANDESGNSNNGTVYGATIVEDRFGNPNSAYHFNGNTDRIAISNSPSLIFTDALTISCWVKFEDLPGAFHSIILSQTGAGYSGWLFDGYNSKMRLCKTGNGFDLGTTSMLNNTWYHLVATFGNSTLTYYLNGVYDGSYAAPQNIIPSGTTLMIGNYNYGVGNQVMIGTIDDINIYNRVLTQIEIDSLYHIGNWFVPDFIGSPISGITPLNVNFTDHTIGNPTSRKWDFENDGIYDAFVQNPSHLYNSSGAYSVKLVVSNGNAVDSITKNNYISIIPFIYHGPTWHVAVTGSNITGNGSELYPFRTIQQGIDASQSGDTVLVQPGTYFEHINYNGKNIVLGSKFLTTVDENYIEQTIIDGDAYGLPCVRFMTGESAETKLVGFTLQNGYTGSDEFGGGVYISGGSSPVLDHLIIKNNIANSGRGGGISCYYGGVVKISNTLFENNYSSEAGGAIYLFSTFAEITNCEFKNNSASWGGAILVFRASALIKNSVIHNNTGNDAAINIHEASETVNFINSVICNNNAPVGILLTGTCKPKMINSIVTGHSEYNIQILPDCGPFYIDYSLIAGGQEGIGIDNPSQLFYYEHNMDQSPEFINPAEGNYALSDYSPAIGKGINELVWGDDTLTAPAFDKEYNSRPMPSGSMPDIGAYENPLGQPLGSSENIFSEITTSLSGVHGGDVQWGDYDNDGDLDALVAGYIDQIYYERINGSVKIYRNDGNDTFTDINAVFPLSGYISGHAAWADIDNDNDLDVALIYRDAFNPNSSHHTKIYENTGSNAFSDIGVTLVGGFIATLAWTDFDLDGYQDLFVQGDASNAAYFAKVYKNNGNHTFTDINAGMQGAMCGNSAVWGDYNNDSYPDIFYGGFSYGVTYAKLYENNGDGTFTDIFTGIPPTGFSCWLDFNNDGFEDIISRSSTGEYSEIFKNNGNSTFTGTELFFPSYSQGTGVLECRDYDKDGFEDILVLGTYNYLNALSKNINGASFNVVLNTGIDSLASSDAAFGDYNGDGMPDLLVQGWDGEKNVVKIYKNLLIPPIFVDLPDTIMTCHEPFVELNAGPGFTSYLWNTGETSQSILVTETGTYSVTVEDQFGNTATDSTYVNIINVQIAQNDTTILAGQSLGLSLTGGTAVITDGLVGYWPFNGNANDESGSGNNGTVNGAILTIDRFGNPNSAYSFNGSGYINCGNDNSLNFSNTFTLNCWAKTTSPESNCGMLGRWSNNSYNTEQYVIQFEDNFVQSFISSGTNGIGVSSEFNYYNDIWHFYTMSYDGMFNKLFIDGQLVASQPFSESINNVDNDFVIGAYSIWFYNNYWDGDIDDISAYNRTLSQSEISALYNESSNYSAYSYLWFTGETTQTITVSPDQTTTYYVEITDGINWCTDSVTVTVEHPVELELKAFLEGPFFNDGMTPWLNFFEAIPLSQPYNTSPWNYPGNESVTQISSFNEIDWVLVELLVPVADTSNNVAFESVARKAGFILTNGWIKDVDGTSNLTFTGLNTSQFYVRVHHRNHLQITSSDFIPGSNGIFSYDFTTDASKAMGGANVQKELNTGIWGMMSCDGNADGQIDNNDKNDVWLPQRNTSGYLSGDFNMDRQVSNVDKVSYWKFNAGHGVPDEGLTIVQPFTCGDPLIDARDGQSYNTVQIGQQCWMAENLNIGTMIPGLNDMANNSIIEKYCYDNLETNCDTYGGLYQWNEMMQYVNTEGVQGICPDGWHLPTDAEWCILNQFIDSTVDCDAGGWGDGSGTDVGTKMKSTNGWNCGYGTNTVGFNALPGGWREFGLFHNFGASSTFWSSSEYDIAAAWYRELYCGYNIIGRDPLSKEIYGFGVRCLKDN